MTNGLDTRETIKKTIGTAFENPLNPALDKAALMRSKIIYK